MLLCTGDGAAVPDSSVRGPMTSPPCRRLLFMAPVVVRLSAPVAPAEAAALCLAIRQRLASGASRIVVCHVLGPVDVSVVGVLARMQLMARRLTCTLQVRFRSSDLPALLELTGLDDVVPLWLEPRRQAEAGEQRRVEEVVDVPDLPV